MLKIKIAQTFSNESFHIQKKKTFKNACFAFKFPGRRHFE